MIHHNPDSERHKVFGVKSSKATVTTIKRERTMKTIYSIFLMVAAVPLLALSVPVHASKMDDRIESTAKKS
jgi:hypothetical protein